MDLFTFSYLLVNLQNYYVRKFHASIKELCSLNSASQLFAPSAGDACIDCCSLGAAAEERGFGPAMHIAAPCTAD